MVINDPQRMRGLDLRPPSFEALVLAKLLIIDEFRTPPPKLIKIASQIDQK